MTYHIPTENRTLQSISDLKKWALPTLLSKRPTAAEIEPLGAFIVQIDPAPEVAATQVAEPGEVTHENGVSRQTWNVRDRTPQEILDGLPYQNKEQAKAQVLEWADSFLAPMERGYSKKEVQSWPVKGPAAINYLDGSATAAETLILQAETDALQVLSPGITVDDVAANIATKAPKYLAALAFTSALRQIVNAQIDATTELAEIPPILEAAIAAATAKAQALDLPEADT